MIAGYEMTTRKSLAWLLEQSCHTTIELSMTDLDRAFWNSKLWELRFEQVSDDVCLIRNYNPNHDSDTGEFSDGGGQVTSGGDASPDQLNSASQEMGAAIATIEGQGNGDPSNHEYAARAHIDTALDAALHTRLSQKRYVRTAFVFQGNKAVAGGLMAFSRDGKTATIENLGSMTKGGGTKVVNSLINQAQQKGGIKTIRALPENQTARGFFTHLGFISKTDSPWMERKL